MMVQTMIMIIVIKIEKYPCYFYHCYVVVLTAQLRWTSRRNSASRARLTLKEDRGHAITSNKNVWASHK